MFPHFYAQPVLIGHCYLGQTPFTTFQINAFPNVWTPKAQQGCATTMPVYSNSFKTTWGRHFGSRGDHRPPLIYPNRLEVRCPVPWTISPFTTVKGLVPSQFPLLLYLPDGRNLI